MEEEHNNQNEVFGGDSGLGIRVMTDEQMEMLRKQISVYVHISQSLVQMHKFISSQPDFSSGMGNPYTDPFLSYGYHKNTSLRQRWAPKPEQLQILESIYEESKATPDRQRIRQITNQLSVHGPISETNIYNWFQNRRARSKRKQAALPVPPPPNNGESAKENDTKQDDIPSDENLAVMYFQSPDIGIEGIDQLMGGAEGPMA